jgi:hypothetical protein
MTGQEMRVHVKRNSKKKSGYEVEKREDGFFYGKQRSRVESNTVRYFPSMITVISCLAGKILFSTVRSFFHSKF